MDLRALERKRAALDEKIKAAREVEQKKAKFSALIAKLRPELLNLNEDEIKAIVIPTQPETQPQPQQVGGINE